MAKSQIDAYIENMRNGTSGGSLLSGLDETPKKKIETRPQNTPSSKKYEPTFEEQQAVKEKQMAHRFKRDETTKDPAEKGRKTVGVEMTEEEIYRIDKASYMLKITKRELIRTAVFEYLTKCGV